MTLTIKVLGCPKPQGSKKYVGHSKKGHAIMVESCKELPNWREAVKWACREQWGDSCHTPMISPLSVTMVFTLPRPKSCHKSRLWPDRKPDLSKLVRSTEDALVDAGVIEDDARIVEMQVKKLYPCNCARENCISLKSPGCVIEIRTL